MAKDSPATPKEIFVREATGLTRQIGAKDAMMFNLLDIGIPWTFIYLFFAALLFPGVNVPLTVLIAMPLMIVFAATYYFLTVLMPRTGGDFVWVSRILHPAIGFMNNFALAIFFLSFLGPVSQWLFSYGIGTMLINLGTVTGNSSYFTMANSLNGTIPTLIAGLIVLGVIAGAAVAGLKWAFRLMWGTFILIAISTVTFLLVMATTSNATFASNFDKMSGLNYANLITTAHGAGYITSFTLIGTLLGSTFTFLNYFGFNFSTFIGGEVKSSNKSQLWGIMGSAVVFGLVNILIYGAAYAVMGQPFLHAASFLSGSGNSAWTLPSQPVLHYLVVFANPNPIVAIIVPLAIVASVFGALETILVAVVRQSFAWSFDRIIPTKFSEVDSRFASPNYALGLITAVGLFFVLINTFYPHVLQFLSYATAGLFAVGAIVGFTAAILPFRRKDLLDASPLLSKRKWLVVVCGVITFIGGIVIAAATLSPAYLQATTGGASISPANIAGLFATFGIGLLIYVISYGVRKRSGIDLRLTMREIPPE